MNTANHHHKENLVILIDVDNTLLDNDRFGADLSVQLNGDFGAKELARYWAIFTELRDRLGYADYLRALQQFRTGQENDPAILNMSKFLLEYPFSARFYVHAIDTLAHLKKMGNTVILSDGDMVFQPRKIQRSGIWDAVDGQVLIYVHKEKQLDMMQQRFPASHYVMIDDKPQILSAMKRVLNNQLTTVFVRQGHYATEAEMSKIDPSPDYTFEKIGDLRALPLHFFEPQRIM
jgi:FMN phosphatase YigB (HAD superfamily)